MTHNKQLGHFVRFILILALASCGPLEYVKITSTSMEGTLLVGDKLQIQNVDKFEHNQIIVFKHRYEGEEEVLWTFRIIGIPGDKVAIVNGDVYLNDKKLMDPINVKYEYRIRTIDALNMKRYNGFELVDDSIHMVYTGYLTSSQVEELRKNNVIKSIDKVVQSANNYSSMDFFGPFTIPKVGQKINIDNAYKFLFQNVPHGDEITPTENLYFVMGDNRHNSADSRLTGLVCETSIVGILNK